MQSIMLGLNAVTGVIGGMLSDEHGNVLASSFPAYFDTGTVKGAAEMVHDSTLGLQDATGGVKLFDIRSELGRLIIRPLPRMYVVVLCQPAVNIQLLYISMNVAVKKIEKIASDPQFLSTIQQAAPPVKSAPSVAAAPAKAASAPTGRYTAVSDGKGILLTCKVMTTPDALFGVDSACVNRHTAHEICGYFEIDSFKKLQITNPANGIKKKVPVAVMKEDREGVYDGEIFPSKSFLESLRVKEGDKLRVEVITGGGLFG